MVHFKGIIICVVFFCGINDLQISAQNSKVTGCIINNLGEPMPYTTVVLLDAKDSVLKNFVSTDTLGNFIFESVEKGNCLLQVSQVGYNNLYFSLNIGTEKNSYDIGKLQLKEKSIELKTVSIEAEQMPVVLKNDTVEYNAGSFKTQPDAVVEDLLKKLPGIQVEKDGTIKAQGQKVNKVLVDGKPFFGDDPKMATKNLPANAVDKVQLFDKKSEMAEFTGVDDGESEKTINIKLKEDKKKGFFGNVKGGIGTNERFEGKFNLNRFNNKTQLSTIGQANNTNQQGFTFDDYLNMMGGIQNLMNSSNNIEIDGLGMPFGMGNPGGLNTSYAGGVNANYDISKKLEFNSSYFYNRSVNDTKSELYRKNFTSDNTYSTNENSTSLKINDNHKLNLAVKYKIDSLQNIKFKTDLSYFTATSLSSSNTYNYSGAGLLKNSSLANDKTKGLGMNVNSSFVYRRKFNKKGRSFVSEISFGKKQNNSTENLDYINGISLTDSLGTWNSDTVFQRQNYDNGQLNYGAKFSYKEPIGKSKFMELIYSHSDLLKNAVKKYYDVFPVQNDESLNTQLSNLYNSRFYYDRVVLNLVFNSTNWNLTGGIGLQASQLIGSSSNSVYSVNRNFLNVLPSMFVHGKPGKGKRIDIFYQTNIKEPSVEQLQPVVNNSNPLNIFIGNPSLKAQYNHNTSIRYSSFNNFSFTTFFASLNVNVTNNSIVSSTSIDSFLVRSSTPINSGLSYSCSSNISFDGPVKLIRGKFKISNIESYSKVLTLINNTKGISDKWSHTVDLSIENKKKDNIDVSAGTKLTYSTIKYSLGNNQNYLTNSYYSDVSVFIGKKWNAGTSGNYTVYPKGELLPRQEIFLCDAFVSMKFLKANKGLVKLSANNIFDQSTGIYQGGQGNYIEEQKINSLGRYFLLSLSWSPSGF